MVKQAQLFYERDRRRRSAFRITWWVDTVEEMEEVGDTTYLGLREIRRDGRARDPETTLGGYEVTITYEGLRPDDASADEERETWSLDADYREEPIESHSNLPAILEAYNGTEEDGEVKFPYPAPEGITAGTGLSGGGNTAQTETDEKNPAFGWTTYPVHTALATRTRVVDDGFNEDLLAKKGKILNELPSTAPSFYKTPPNHNWFAKPPKHRELGTGHEIYEEYILSEPGGWPELIVGIIE